LKRSRGRKAPRKRSDWRWVQIDEERWEKLRRHMGTMDPALFPGKLSVNRVGSMMLAKAIDALPE